MVIGAEQSPSRESSRTPSREASVKQRYHGQMGEDGLNPWFKVRFKCHFCRVVGSMFYGHEAN